MSEKCHIIEDTGNAEFSATHLSLRISFLSSESSEKQERQPLLTSQAVPFQETDSFSKGTAYIPWKMSPRLRQRSNR
jgi:hypothetical protein